MHQQSQHLIHQQGHLASPSNKCHLTYCSACTVAHSTCSTNMPLPHIQGFAHPFQLCSYSALNLDTSHAVLCQLKVQLSFKCTGWQWVHANDAVSYADDTATATGHNTACSSYSSFRSSVSCSFCFFRNSSQESPLAVSQQLLLGKPQQR